MATRSSASSSKDVEIVELQLTLNPRGRSVVHGTLVIDGSMRTIKHELSAEQKIALGEFILKALT